MRRRIAAALVAALVVGGGLVGFPPVGGATASAANISSSQLLSVEGQFFCVSCHQPLNQVYSAEAQAEKQTLAQLYDAGLPLSQIKAQMVADYGQGVLANPSNPWIYIVPIAAVIAALGTLAWVLPRWRRRKAAAVAADPLTATPAASDAERARLERELDAF